MKTQRKPHIVIYIEGGCIQEIASTQDVEISVVDYDQAECGDDPFIEDYPTEITKNPLKYFEEWKQEEIEKEKHRSVSTITVTTTSRKVEPNEE